MSQKIIEQKRASSLNTVFESSKICLYNIFLNIETETVSCILWPKLLSNRGSNNFYKEDDEEIHRLD
jgi:hypothetical protein